MIRHSEVPEVRDRQKKINLNHRQLYIHLDSGEKVFFVFFLH